MTYKLVLVTGGTGFIGAHVVDELLRRGIAVRIASRTSAKAERLIADRGDKASFLSYCLIDDFESTAGGLDEAAKGCDGIIHVASPLSYDVKDFEKELIRPAIAGVKVIMHAAAEAKTVQRVVLTSSFASVLDLSRGPRPGFTYTGADWNPLTYEEATKADAVVAYRGSKKFAELEAWNFVKNNKESINFDLVALCPPMTFGPIVHPLTSVSELNVSNEVLWSIANGVDPLPVSRVPVWIDVRNLAFAHVEALLRPEVGGKRYVPASPEFFSYQLAADIMRDTFSWAKDRITPGNPGEPIVPSYELDGQAVSKDLGVQYISFKKTVIDCISQFKDMPGSDIK